MDKRKQNGGARPNSGPKPMSPDEKKVQVIFYIKRKYADEFRVRGIELAEKINNNLK